jgi:hypothetical protein
VCFSTLPLRFRAATANVPKGNKALYLSGFTAGGIRLYKQVVAWRLELDGEQPRFLVLAPGYRGGWLCLVNACKMYKHTAKNVLMTAQMLHFLRRNPDGPEIALWIHLHQVFGYFGSLVALSRLFLLLVDGERVLQISLVLLQQVLVYALGG